MKTHGVRVRAQSSAVTRSNGIGRRTMGALVWLVSLMTMLVSHSTFAQAVPAITGDSAFSNASFRVSSEVRNSVIRAKCLTLLFDEESNPAPFLQSNHTIDTVHIVSSSGQVLRHESITIRAPTFDPDDLQRLVNCNHLTNLEIRCKKAIPDLISSVISNSFLISTIETFDELDSPQIFRLSTFRKQFDFSR